MTFRSLRAAHFAAAVPVILTASMSAQNLPDELDISSDGRRLVTGGQPETGFYREDTVRAIYLTFSQSDFWDQLISSYDTGIPVMATLACDGSTFDSVGVKFKGETSYFMLPNGSEKMSFDITLDEWVDGQDLHGYDGINLNNGFQDNTMMRDVLYKHLIRPHVPAAKACFSKLYINGENWGLYSMVQDLDGDFIKQWWFSNDGSRWRAQRPTGGMGGQWGDGTAALNYLGGDTASYQTYYTLKNSDQPDPWTELVTTCDKLNNTALGQLADTIEKYMDIDRVLWHLASENAFADDDSYIHKGKSDYSLYFEPETGRMTTQEIDGNSVLDQMNLSWSPFYHADNVNYPLLNRLLQVQELRQRYLAHLRTVITTSLDATQATTLTTTYKTLIDTVVQNDPKKLMTYTQFISGVTTLANNVSTRRNNLLANTEVAQVAPVIGAVDHEVAAGLNEAPQANETAHVRAQVTSANGINGVRMYWSNALPGRFQYTQMYDDGAHDDVDAGDGVFGADIPGYGGGTWVRYYIEAKADNAAQSAVYAPAGAEHDVYTYQVATSNSPNVAIVINEVMASNSATAMDENDEYEDWIELYNTGNNAVDLEGWYLTDTPFEPTKWQLPGGTLMAPGTYMIVWADEDASQGAMHANFKLSGSGESVLLYDPDTLLVDNVDFGEQVTDQGYARVPNGTGPFIVQTPTFGANNDNVGISESAVAAGFRLYPNPATTQVLVVWDDPVPQTVSIMDATQRTVWSGKVRSGSPIDVSAFAGGTYVVRLPHGSQRLVVVR
jgi:hypothetical protein